MCLKYRLETQVVRGGYVCAQAGKVKPKVKVKAKAKEVSF